MQHRNMAFWVPQEVQLKKLALEASESLASARKYLIQTEIQLLTDTVELF
jgi:hypothetical protein